MSTTAQQEQTAEKDAPRTGWAALSSGTRIGLALVALFLVLSISRQIGKAPDLTSGFAFSAALTFTVPILFAGLGGLLSERVGIVNIGLEGMMILGTWFGGWAGWHWGPWACVLGGFVGGALLGLLHAVACVTFGVNHVISGVAISTFLGFGIARFLASIVFDGVPGASASIGPAVKGSMGNFTLPLLSGGDLFGWRSPDPLGWLDKKRWFFVSDVAGMLKGLTSSVSWLTVVALLIVPAVWWFLWRTPIGLRLRSVGERPSAADSLGVPVYKLQYLAVTLSGGLAGLGGAALVLDGSRNFQEGQTGGKGFIGLASLIIGNWRPGGVAAGAGLFGFATSIANRNPRSVRALLLFLAIALAAVMVRAIVRRKPIGAVIAAAGAGYFIWYYNITEKVPNQIIYITPYLVVLLVLVFASQRLRPPAADGKIWRKGQVE